MGSSSSKAARGASRKFPTRAPGTAVPPSSAAQRARAPPASTATETPAGGVEASQADLTSSQSTPPRPDTTVNASSHEADASNGGSDPASNQDVTAAFSARLHQMGVAQPNPTYSPSSRANESLGPDPAAAKPASPTQAPGGAPVFASQAFAAASRRQNPTLAALEARRALQKKAEEEFEGLGRSGSEGREFLDIHTLVQVHLMREAGAKEGDIERRFNLKKGVVARLGSRGVTIPASAVRGEEMAA